MSKTLRHFLTLCLCLLLFVCVAPAAFADGASGSTLQDLLGAIADGADSFTLTGNITVTPETVVNCMGTDIKPPHGADRT